MMNRRRFVYCSAGCVLFSTVSSFVHAALQETVPRSHAELNELKAPTSGAEWLERALQSRSVTNPLQLSRFYERMFFLLAPIEWDRNPGETGPEKVIAPTGFVTDLASIPRVLWSIWPSDGSYAYPAIIHDYLYWAQPCTRLEADDVLKFGMQDFHIDKVTINAIYEGVRVGGQSSWDDNARSKANGERRILKTFPQDPTTHWSEWKKDKAHFLS